MSDRIRVKCSKCAGQFNEPMRRIRADAEIACPLCKTPIVFKSGSEDENIRRALSAARKARLAQTNA
jgi:DNA-directed RNA polymerase subunit RPC12/RpoP